MEDMDSKKNADGKKEAGLDAWDVTKAYSICMMYSDDDACGKYFHTRNVQNYAEKVWNYVENHLEKYTDKESVRDVQRCLYSIRRAVEKRRESILALLQLNHRCRPYLSIRDFFGIIDDFEEHRSDLPLMRHGYCYFLPKIIEVCKIDDPEQEGFGTNYGKVQRKKCLKATKDMEKRRIEELVQDPDMTLEGMVEILRAEGYKIGKSTIKNRLTELGISWRMKKKELKKKELKKKELKKKELKKKELKKKESENERE